MALRWSGLGSNRVYTVESRDALAGGSWAAVPWSVWPVPWLSWNDLVPGTNRARFYRITAGDAESIRGKLLSATELASLSVSNIQTLFSQAGIPLTAGMAVRAYKLTYQTLNPFRCPTMATGLLVMPESPTNALPLVSYQHGTIVQKNGAPSGMQGLEPVIGIVMATSGYIAVLPDYVGLGDSPGLHPFLHAPSEAAAVIDLLRASRAFCSNNLVSLNGQLFLMGYSQGGHATMAAHREIEVHLTNEFKVTASAPMAGPYDLSGVTSQDFLSGRSMPNPYYFVYLIAAYQSIYQFAGTYSEILASPWDRTLPPLLDGLHDGSDINAAMGTEVATNAVNPEFLAAFRSNPFHPLRLALQVNDVYNWKPSAPMRLYQCGGDQDVLFANSQVAYQTFVANGATQVQLVEPSSTLDHTACAPLSLFLVKLWFDSLVRH